MSSSKEVKYTSRSITPPARRSKSRSSSRSRGRSRSRSQDSLEANNPGNNLYVTGLSPRVTSEDLEKYFNKEGKVQECQVVTDPRTKESRGFAFVTMETVEDANRCVKYLNQSVLEGRLMVVEKRDLHTYHTILRPKGAAGGHPLLENTAVHGKEEIVEGNDLEATHRLSNAILNDHIRGREVGGNDPANQHWRESHRRRIEISVSW